MKGYKATNRYMSCCPQFDSPLYQYTMGTKHILEKGEVEICSNGFHYCEKLENVLYYYNHPSMRVFEILAEGDIDTLEHKSACSEITFIKELTLDDLVNDITKPELAIVYSHNIDKKHNLKLRELIKGNQIEGWLKANPDDLYYFLRKYPMNVILLSFMNVIDIVMAVFLVFVIFIISKT